MHQKLLKVAESQNGKIQLYIVKPEGNMDIEFRIWILKCGGSALVMQD